MEKLQLHEIAGYLPYGLKCRLSHIGRVNLDSEYPNEHQHKSGVIKHFSVYEDEFSGSFSVTDRYSFDFDEQSEIEIILRPMSDLTRPMLEESGFECHIDYLTYELKGLIHKFGINTVVNMLPYGHCVWLYKNHFDIHNLIGRGLAIDINTI